MAIPEKPTLATPPAAPVRGEDPTTFANKANAYVAFIGTNVTDLTGAIDWQNTVFTATETEATNAADSASNATAQKVLAENAATLAESTANFVGQWSTLTGALNVPAVVFHSAGYWQLLVNLADVTTSEPGTNGDWAVAIVKPNWGSVSASVTLIVNSYSAVDFGTGTLTITLPPIPSENDFIQLYKSAGVAEGTTIARNGETIMGLSEDLTIDTEANSLYLVYNGTDWRIVR